MNFSKIATMDFAGVPLWVLVVGVLAVALAWWWYQERSKRGVQRRAERSTQRALGGVGVAVGGIVGVSTGALRGVLGIGGDVLGSFGDLFLELIGGIVYAATTGLGFAVIDGRIPLSAKAFAVVAVALFLLGVALDE